jgi:protein-disulfide isomerase
LDTHEDRIEEKDSAMANPRPVSAGGNPLAIVVVGLVMLGIGITIGFFGRPLVTPEPLDAAPVASVDTPESPVVSESDANPDGGNPSPAMLMDTVVAQTRHFKGDPDAPITIVEFSDFRCPYCGRFTNEAGRQIDEQYIEEGLVRFGYQHFAFLGPESQAAAEASECAAEQDAFWEYHDALFGDQAGVSVDGLSRFADELGLDVEAFDDCLGSGKYTSLVRGETASAQSLGVTGTPSFLINGRPLVGALPFDAFQQVIEAELEQVNGE